MNKQINNYIGSVMLQFITFYNNNLYSANFSGAMRNFIKYNIENVKGARRATSLIQRQPKMQSPNKYKGYKKKQANDNLTDQVKRLENQISQMRNQSHIVEDIMQIKNDIKMIKSNLFGSSNSKLKKTQYDDDEQETVYTLGKQARMKSNNSQGEQLGQNSLGVNQYNAQYGSSAGNGNLKNSRTSNSNSPQKRIYKIQDILEQRMKKSGSAYNKPGVQLKAIQIATKDYKLQGPQSGTIFFGYGKRNSQPVAVKFFEGKIDQVIEVYDRLWKNIAKAEWPCINRILDYKVDEMNFLVMERNKTNIIGLPYKRVLIDLIKIMEFIHDCGYLYRNIEPQHFMLNQEGQLVAIDLKRAKRYIDIKGHPIEICDTVYTGSPFASNNQVRGLSQSRKDDLESIGYFALLLYEMQIPWAGMGKQQVIKIRSGLTLQELFKQRPQLIEYMAYVMRLPKTQRPDYRYLCQLINKI